MEPPTLSASTLTRISALSASGMRWSLTMGVPPIASRMFSKTNRNPPLTNRMLFYYMQIWRLWQVFYSKKSGVKKFVSSNRPRNLLFFEGHDIIKCRKNRLKTGPGAGSGSPPFFARDAGVRPKGSRCRKGCETWRKFDRGFAASPLFQRGLFGRAAKERA